MSRLRLLADENVPKSVVEKLRAHGLDVASVWEYRPGLDSLNAIDSHPDPESQDHASQPSLGPRMVH